MTHITPDQLFTAALDALERTAFLCAEPTETVLDAPVHAHVRYDGPSGGSVTVAADDACLVELASSLLGADPDSVAPEREGVDALKELANIMGGSVLRLLGSETQPFRLSVPVAACPAPCPRSVICRLLVEGLPMVVTWRPDAAAA